MYVMNITNLLGEKISFNFNNSIEILEHLNDSVTKENIESISVETLEGKSISGYNKIVDHFLDRAKREMYIQPY